MENIFLGLALFFLFLNNTISFFSIIKLEEKVKKLEELHEIKND